MIQATKKKLGKKNYIKYKQPTISLLVTKDQLISYFILFL